MLENLYHHKPAIEDCLVDLQQQTERKKRVYSGTYDIFEGCGTSSDILQDCGGGAGHAHVAWSNA